MFSRNAQRRFREVYRLVGGLHSEMFMAVSWQSGRTPHGPRAREPHSSARCGAHQVEDPTFVRFTRGPSLVSTKAPRRPRAQLGGETERERERATQHRCSLGLAARRRPRRAIIFRSTSGTFRAFASSINRALRFTPCLLSFHSLPSGSRRARRRYHKYTRIHSHTDTHVHARCGSRETPITSRRY